MCKQPPCPERLVPLRHCPPARLGGARQRDTRLANAACRLGGCCAPRFDDLTRQGRNRFFTNTFPPHLRLKDTRCKPSLVVTCTVTTSFEGKKLDYKCMYVHHAPSGFGYVDLGVWFLSVWRPLLHQSPSSDSSEVFPAPVPPQPSQRALLISALLPGARTPPPPPLHTRP